MIIKGLQATPYPETRTGGRGGLLPDLPRSFMDSNGGGFGDLQGIIDRLDYLNDGTPLPRH